MSQERYPTVVIVEDDPTLSFMMGEMCRSAGFPVVGSAPSADEAIRLVDRERPDFLILDFNLEGDRNGLELISEAKEHYPSLSTILVTAWDINDIASRMEGDQPDRILRKPVLPHVLVEVIEHIHELRGAGVPPVGAPPRHDSRPGRSH
ncbi:response regulator [Qipengyuania aurantiaca]|uniref:Response regulator n=1 Tax=Qipengyuania aurantiaca TaxID=2867233 RepID=A0ABX8ZU02_9SPHN|nr:response regulator [Qipengyuania aurantiaca]QZD90633.1 response regulator [Qipengyuania aurantiaca]